MELLSQRKPADDQGLRKIQKYTSQYQESVVILHALCIVHYKDQVQ